jgi:HEPN domain-containing protein
MVDAAEFDRWRATAAETLRAAEVQAEAGIHHWSCFLAEQAAELAIKGFLHGVGVGAWGHDLVALGESLREQVGSSAVDVMSGSLRRLSRHYIPARYPDAHPSGPVGSHYGPEDSVQALDDARLVLRDVEDLWQRVSSGEGEP